MPRMSARLCKLGYSGQVVRFRGSGRALGVRRAPAAAPDARCAGQGVGLIMLYAHVREWEEQLIALGLRRNRHRCTNYAPIHVWPPDNERRMTHSGPAHRCGSCPVTEPRP